MKKSYAFLVGAVVCRSTEKASFPTPHQHCLRDVTHQCQSHPLYSSSERKSAMLCYTSGGTYWEKHIELSSVSWMPVAEID
ncbi:hypothetical protein Ocin01_15135 [Orchesella cincta]|uniref:Uncharacterized protein n=1 Tax=Orchesella cincta TaxID=48709 RepID=A0A1D2MEW9_ORCCI|nr:hypothetical protein Ocin01_15135 [Orchesella cincta]